MSDLVEFLTARLGEDEAAAKAAQLRFPGPWEQADNTDSPLPGAVTIYDARDESVGVIRGSYAAAHIARHDPARVLREVEAKRSLIELHKPNGNPADEWYGHDVRCEECGGIGGSPAIGERGFQRSWPCRTLRTLAAVYRDHPDYRQE